MVLIGGGSNIVSENHGLIPASLHRLTIDAAHNQNAIIQPIPNIHKLIAQPISPINITVSGELIKNTARANIVERTHNTHPIKNVPQYSLREALPSKTKYFLYFSILFITLTSLLNRYYQWWLTIYS